MEKEISGLTVALIIAIVILAIAVVLVYFFAYTWLEYSAPAFVPKILLHAADRLQ